MKRIILLVALIISIIALTISILMTYALFESSVSADISVEKATWKIIVNNTDITKEDNKKFVIDKVNINENSHTETGKLAPGVSGYFNILIDPTNTEVSVKYDVTFDLTNLDRTKIQIESIKETILGKELIKTGKNTYTGVISLEKIKKGKKNEITVNLNWQEDETTNKEDTEMGSIISNKIEIPVSIKVSQYLGEEIKSIET